jgi:hypothetical protein
MSEVTMQWTEARPPDAALSQLLTDQLETIVAQGYRIGRWQARLISFRRRRFYHRDQNFTITATAGKASGSIVRVEGSMPPELESVFGKLGDRNRSQAHDWGEREDELRGIYQLVGKPSAFPEAKSKVILLADRLATERGIDRDQALRLAYERSLAEHREYLAANRISRHPGRPPAKERVAPNELTPLTRTHLTH